MHILFIGDIYSESGRLALHSYLPKIKETLPVDLVIANGENVTHGRGLSQRHYAELVNAGVDFFTMGNHTFDNPEISNLLRNKPNVIRPLNLEDCFDGDGTKVIDVNGCKIRITNVICKVFTGIRDYEIENPFDSLDDLLDEASEDIHIVDLHGEANGEKKSFAKYFDGRVSAVVGTHTHVQTADNQVFNKGTAYISDVGYCGAYDSVLGVNVNDAISFCKEQDHRSHNPAISEDELEFSAVYIDIDESTGKSKSIKRIYLTPENDKIELR